MTCRRIGAKALPKKMHRYLIYTEMNGTCLDRSETQILCLWNTFMLFNDIYSYIVAVFNGTIACVLLHLMVCAMYVCILLMAACIHFKWEMILYIFYQHLEVDAKRLSFCKRNFKINFLARKCLCFVTISMGTLIDRSLLLGNAPYRHLQMYHRQFRIFIKISLVFAPKDPILQILQHWFR